MNRQKGRKERANTFFGTFFAHLAFSAYRITAISHKLLRIIVWAGINSRQENNYPFQM